MAEKYTIECVTIIPVENGFEFKATLCCNGKPVACVEKTNVRSECQFHWFVANCGESDNKQAFIEFITRLFERHLTIKADTFVMRLIKEYCQEKTRFCIDGDYIGIWRTLSKPYSATIKKQIIKCYGDKNPIILNEIIEQE